MFKLSYYIIFSEELNSRGDSVLYCTRSGQAFIVANYIRRNLIEGNFYLIESSIVERLSSAKGLVPIDEDELLTIRQENKQFISENSATTLYSVIQPSANCQLGCYYCGQSHSKDSLSDADADVLVDRIKEKLQSRTYKGLHIGWFGAEPLMGLSQIRKLSHAFINLSSELGIDYTSKIVTNGLSLKPQIYKELVQDLKVRSIEVTLDGTANFHDKHRYLKSGGGSFDLIYENLTKIFSLSNEEKIAPISIRCNVDKKNWDDVSNLIAMLAKDGFHKNISYFYTMGVYSWGQNDAHKGSLSKEEYAEKEIDWLIELIEAGFKPKLIPGRQKQVCAAVNPDFEMYDAFGNIFNCTEVSYAESYVGTSYVLGNLNDPLNVSKNLPLVDWNDQIAIPDKFPCNTCKMLPVCGGACPKSWHEDMRACPSSKFNIKDKLALAYVRYKSELEAFS